MREILESCDFEIVSKGKRDFGDLNVINLNKILVNNYNTYLPE